MAREKAPITIGSVPITYKSITLSVDDNMLGELLKSRSVRLRTICMDPAGRMDIMLDNPNPGKRKRGQDTVEIETDRETMIGMVSPTMKVIFQGDTYSAEFDTRTIGSRPLFSSEKPLSEGITKKLD